MNVIKTVAKINGVSTKEVHQEMLKAIRVGRNNPDPNIQKM